MTVRRNVILPLARAGHSNVSGSARPHAIDLGFRLGRNLTLGQPPLQNLDEFLRNIVEQCRVELTNSRVERAPECSHVLAIQYGLFGSFGGGSCRILLLQRQ
jgi:hypothetical protein